LYEYDGNIILEESMKSISDTEAVRAHTVLYKQRTDAGLHPRFQMMDNKASAAVNESPRKEAIQYQLMPPHIHRHNAAQRAIITFKSLSSLA
jgi:hypothetical protein